MSDERIGRWRVVTAIQRGEWHDLLHARADEAGDAAPAAVAIKRLHRHATAARDLFDAEVALATSLPAHPHVVRGLTHGDDDGRPWLAMALVPGADLRTRRPTSRGQAVAWLRTACAGVAHLHACGWLHGDLGPANLIADGDQVVVCDLGCARAIGADGPVRGTHAYMAPEQIRGERWSPATDVFALGVILWELCAGARLFHRGPSYLTMAAVIAGDVPPLADPALDAIARAALHADPRARLPLPELAARLAGWRAA